MQILAMNHTAGLFPTLEVRGGVIRSDLKGLSLQIAEDFRRIGI